MDNQRYKKALVYWSQDVRPKVRTIYFLAEPCLIAIEGFPVTESWRERAFDGFLEGGRNLIRTGINGLFEGVE